MVHNWYRPKVYHKNKTTNIYATVFGGGVFVITKHFGASFQSLECDHKIVSDYVIHTVIKNVLLYRIPNKYSRLIDIVINAVKLLYIITTSTTPTYAPPPSPPYMYTQNARGEHF